MSLLALIAAEEHELAPMWMAPIAFPIIAAALFVFLGFVVYSFRDVANRHSHKTVSTAHDSASSSSAPHGTVHH